MVAYMLRISETKQMISDDNNLPMRVEQPSLLEYLDSFLPFRIPRIPFVQTAANLDKAAGRLILAKADQRVARIDAVTTKVKHQSAPEARFLKASEIIAEKSLKPNEIHKDAAFAYLEAETNIKFANREKILEQATKQLDSDPPNSDSTKSIDDDWLNTFSRFAEEKSSEELQSLLEKS